MEHGLHSSGWLSCCWENTKTHRSSPLCSSCCSTQPLLNPAPSLRLSHNFLQHLSDLVCWWRQMEHVKERWWFLQIQDPVLSIISSAWFHHPRCLIYKYWGWIAPFWRILCSVPDAIFAEMRGFPSRLQQECCTEGFSGLTGRLSWMGTLGLVSPELNTSNPPAFSTKRECCVFSTNKWFNI